jgi:hypothetical protein
MNAKKLLKEIKQKLNLKTDLQLKAEIGISQPTLIRWRRNGVNLSTKQISALIVKAIKRGKGNARKYSIKPIIEYYPIRPTESKLGAKWEILNMSGTREKKIKEMLHKEHGIYVFYNSQCNAIYVGKAKERNLWGEMKDAFNRAREPQVLWRVKHPSTGCDFLPAYEMRRRIKKRNVYLHDIALYFSAYSIEKDLIDNAEALLIRVFANDLTNENMENFALK